MSPQAMRGTPFFKTSPLNEQLKLALDWSSYNRVTNSGTSITNVASREAERGTIFDIFKHQNIAKPAETCGTTRNSFFPNTLHIKYLK